MKKLSLKKLLKVGVYAAMFLLFLGVLAGCSPPAEEAAPPDVSGDGKIEVEKPSVKDEAAAFYKGKIIQLIVPYEPGGGYDVNSRLLAPYLEKYSGATVVIRNIDGAGGMLGVNEQYLASPDGLTIGIQNAVACVTNQLAGIEGIAFDMQKFGWIGRLTTDVRVLAMRNDFPYKTIEDMLAAPETFKIGATGLGGSTFVDAVIMKNALELDWEIIHGYDSSPQIDMGMLRGEVDGTFGSYTSRLSMLESGDQFVILQSGETRSSELPDVPTWFEIATTDYSKKLITVLEATHSVGRPFAAPPGLPAERLEFLRDVFYQAVHDPEFVADMIKADRPINFLSGEEMERVIDDALNMPEDIKPIFEKTLKGEI